MHKHTKKKNVVDAEYNKTILKGFITCRDEVHNEQSVTWTQTLRTRYHKSVCTWHGRNNLQMVVSWQKDSKCKITRLE